jgi:hypothetical protein
MPRRSARDDDPLMMKLLAFLKTKLNSADMQELEDMLGTDSPEPFEGMPRTGAMDSRMAYDYRSTNPGRIVADRERAIAEVEGTVGRDTVMACDSAASVFRTALKAVGVRAESVHETGLAQMWDMARRNRRGDQANAGFAAAGGSVATESRQVASSPDFARRHPNAARIRTV